MDPNTANNDNVNDKKEEEKDSEPRGTQLYYSPRILPDDDTSGDSKTDEDKSKKILKRFIHSIVREEKDKFHELLSKIDLNSTSSDNSWTPLIWAIQKDRTYFIQEMFETTQIIDFSKQIDKKMKRTVLHFAAEKGDIDLVQLLIQKDKQQQNDSDNTENIALDINAIDKEGSTPLFRAAKVGEAEIIKLLMDHGADPNITNRDEISPLLLASHRGYLDVVQVLLDKKETDPNLEDERGRTALMVACAEDRKSIVKRILKVENLELNSQDKQNFNWNCLMWCVYRKNESTLNILLDYDTKLRFNYFHEDLYGKNSIEQCVEKKLNKKVTAKLRAKYHAILFPELVQSELIVSLGVPLVVMSVLLVFTY
mmetsp:Transcript_37478/g.33124  ORF Transcript_37478/g.33124 Transcript_37478/m.33124 type:complete len:368 (+) Transcript_37478:215-1318(+)